MPIKTTYLRWPLVVAALALSPLPSPRAQEGSTPPATIQKTVEEKAREDMRNYGYQWTLAVAQGRQNTAAAKRAKAHYDGAARHLGFDPDDAIQPQLTSLISPQISGAAWLLSDQVRQGKANGSEAKRLRLRISRLAKIAAVSPADDLKGAFRYRLSNSARSWANEKFKLRPDSSLMQKYETEMRRLEPGAKTSIASVKNEAKQSRLYHPVTKTAARIADLIAEGKGDGAEVGVLRAQLFAGARRLDYDVAPMLSQNLRYRLDEKIQTLARQFIFLRNEREIDISKLEATRTQLLRLTKVRGASLDQRLRLAEDDWLGQAPRNYANSIADENAKDAPDKKLLAFLQAKLESTVARWQAMPTTYSKHDTTAEQFIAEAELNLYSYYYDRKSTYPSQLNVAISALAVEKTLTQPDAAAIARYEAVIAKIKATISPLGQENLKHRFSREAGLWDLRSFLIEKLRKEVPDEKRVAEVEAQFIARQGEDDYVQARKTGAYTRLPPIEDLEEYGRQRVLRIKARIAGEKIEAQLKAPLASLTARETEDLKARRAKLAAREKDLMVRMGDPLIRVFAPRDALRVVAIFPDGTTKNLQWEEENQEWQTRFDVPTYSLETKYTVQLVTVLKNGIQQNQSFSYRVDLTAPQMGVLRAAADDSRLNLEMKTEKNVARVDVILPWNERVGLTQNADKTRFSAQLSVPPEYSGQSISITLILTDRAHNRTIFETDIKPQSQ